MRIFVALQWHRVWEEINLPCINTVFIIKTRTDTDKNWAVVHFDSKAKDGMKILSEFTDFEGALSFAEAQALTIGA